MSSKVFGEGFGQSAAAMLVAAVALCAPVGSEGAEAAGGSPRIVCLGDSLTEGYTLAPEEAWPALLEQRLQGEDWPEAQVVNAGISGSTSASALARLKWQLSAKPDLLVLALGANDGLRGIDPAATKENLAATIDAAQAAGVPVVLAGMRMPPNYGQAYTAEFHALFQDLAKEKGTAFIPFLLEGVAAKPELNLPDGIHPNAAGYKVMLDHVYPFIVTALRDAKP